MYPYKCCCCGGCNCWSLDDGSPGTGFGDNSTCNRCLRNDGTRCGTENNYAGDDCATDECGPSVPTVIPFSASTHWAWGWSRREFALSCMGASSPEASATLTNSGWGCGGDQTGVSMWSTWNAADQTGGVFWVPAGNISMSLRLDNEQAYNLGEWTDGTSTPGGWVDGHPPGCCAKYYYGKCDLAGPATPSISTNPWGYDAADFGGTGEATTTAPTSLEAWGRLELLTGGWAFNYGDLKPHLVMRATLQIWVAIKDWFSNISEVINGNASYRRQMMALVTYSYVEVGGCSCNHGAELIEGIDWSNISSGFWNYRWPYPSSGSADVSDTANYTTTPGVGSGGTYHCGDCGRGTPCPCTAETFTLKGFEGCGEPFCTPTDCSAPWFWRTNVPANTSNKNPANLVWTYAATRGGGHAAGMKNDSGAAWGSGAAVYNQGGTADGHGWKAYNYMRDNGCIALGGGSFNTNRMIGGFVGGGWNTGTTMPACGLTDVSIGVGGGQLS